MVFLASPSVGTFSLVPSPCVYLAFDCQGKRVMICRKERKKMKKKKRAPKLLALKKCMALWTEVGWVSTSNR